MSKRLFSDFERESIPAAMLRTAAKAAVKRAVGGANQCKNSQKQQETALQAAVAHGEAMDRRRLAMRSYRLHPSKWLQMDKMLKSLFFPLNTMRLNFGISSFSGVNNYNYTDALGFAIEDGNTGEVNTARTRGLHRGVALFTVRNTLDVANRTSSSYLNAVHAVVGGTRSTDTGGTGTVKYPAINSIYRRYHNQPELQAGNTSDAGLVFQGKCQTFTDEDVVDMTKIRNLDLGFTLAQMEEIAASSMVYSDPVFNYRPNKNQIGGSTSTVGEYVRGNGNVLAGETAEARPTIKKDGSTLTNNMLTSTEELDGQPAYLGAVGDAVMRIADGELVMDIMNTEQTPCVVEVVIHSKKKNNKTKQEIYNSLYQDIDRKLHRINPNLGDLPSDSPIGGGWQAFYDPSYPLLRIPAGSATANLISEVHRSQHVLYPGQSKEIKISLGSLWYKIMNKNDVTAINNLPNQLYQKLKDNVGSLYVAIGHSGFEFPQQPFGMPGTTASWTAPNVGVGSGDGEKQGTPFSGTGFWVGKAHAPSSISISGKYAEKFYPLTFDRSAHTELVSTCAGRPAFITDSSLAGQTPAVPLAVIVNDRVATNQEGVIQKLAAGGTNL